MQSAVDIASQIERLLRSIELDEALNSVAEIVTEVCSPQALAILMWDSDLESFEETFIFGPKKKDLQKLAEAVSAEEPKDLDKKVVELDLDDLGVTLPKGLDPVFCCPVVKDDQLCALILIANPGIAEEDELAEALEPYPFFPSLSNGWEHRELQRENQRLRSQYEEMEERVGQMEEQTSKLIRDMTSRDVLRTRQKERERLVYWISNAVRSSLHIQEVLDNTVEKIGTEIGVSRCIIIRAVDTSERINVFEWHQQNTPSSKNLFFSDEGMSFSSAALSSTSPHDLVDPALDTQSKYSKEFLQKFDIRSGLIVPLVLRDKTLGVLFLQDCVQPRDWSIDDVSMIGSLADNLSVAIENAELHQERERQAVTDGLTGVANRRSFNESFTREFERARRYAETLSLVLIDLDFLKKINDTYGHQAGDEAIKSIGKVLKQECRSIDTAARYGGEEFCLLLPNTEIDMAEQMADRLRKLINETAIEGPGNISASLGVASYPLHADNEDTLFQRADEALYAAKQGGRNQVKVATPADGSDGAAHSAKGDAAAHPVKAENPPIAEGAAHSGTADAAATPDTNGAHDAGKESKMIDVK